MKWVTRFGRNMTTQQVVEQVNRATGGSYTVESFENTFCVGDVYQNGGMWFQRVAK